MENFDLFANASVDTIDLVPETLRGYYVEDKGAGTFNLKEDIKPLAQALSLSNKAVKELKTKKTDDNKKDANRRGLITGLMGKLTELGIDVGDDEGKLVDVVGTKIAELMDNVKNGKEVKTNIDAIRKDFDKRLATEIGKKDAVLGSMKKSLEKHMIGSAAALALSTSNVIENGVDLMMPQITKYARLVQDEETGEYSVKVVDDQNNVRFNTKGEDLTISELVSEMKLKFPTAFKSEVKKGTGAPLNNNRPNVNTKVGKDGADEKTAVGKIAAGLAAGLLKK